MPVQVRVGDTLVNVAMTGGRGRVAVPKGASVTLDPASKVLRELPHMAAFHKDRAERVKAAEARAKAASAK